MQAAVRAIRNLGFLGWLWGFFAIYLVLGTVANLILLGSDAGGLSWTMLMVDAAVFAMLLTLSVVVGVVRRLRQ